MIKDLPKLVCDDWVCSKLKEIKLLQTRMTAFSKMAKSFKIFI